MRTVVLEACRRVSYGCFKRVAGFENEYRGQQWVRGWLATLTNERKDQRRYLCDMGSTGYVNGLSVAGGSHRRLFECVIRCAEGFPLSQG